MPSGLRNWRLFGRLNLLDILLLLIILIVTARYVQNRWVGQQRPIGVTFVVKAVIPVTSDALSEGDALFDSKTGKELGRIVSVGSQPAVMTGLASDYSSTELVDVYVGMRGPGRITPDQIWLGGKAVRVGQAFDLQTRSWAGKAYPVMLNLAP